MTTDAPPVRRRRVSTRSGLFWAAVFTLGPYVLGMLAILIVSWPLDTPAEGAPCEGLGFGCTPVPRDLAFLLLAMSAPFAVLATGVAWLIVLLLRMGPAKAWPGLAQGGVAAVLVYAVAAILLALQLGPAAANPLGYFALPG